MRRPPERGSACVVENEDMRELVTVGAGVVKSAVSAQKGARVGGGTLTAGS